MDHQGRDSVVAMDSCFSERDTSTTDLATSKGRSNNSLEAPPL